MIITLMNQKRGLNRFSKLPEDGDPWAPNNLLKPEAKEKYQLNPGGSSNRQEVRPQPTKMNNFMSGPSQSLMPDPLECIVINHDWVKN